MLPYFTLRDLENWGESGAKLAPPARLSVFGDPVAHSLSPQMHNPALAECGIDAQYVRIEVKTADFQRTLRLIHDAGFFGTNVTIPHKFTALQSVDVVEEQARRLGAVNTVIFRQGSAMGRNSDGPGFVRTVREEFGAALRDLRVLILGAGGGAGRAVAVQCALENCPQLLLANRTQEKAAALQRELAQQHAARGALVVPWDEASLASACQDADLIINGTNLGMRQEDPDLLPEGALESRHLVYDMVYKPLETRLYLAARRAGATVINGLPMLLHQGAVSFEWWFNRPAPLEVMRRGLWSAAGWQT
jgi:shikimate dehydrogenase